LSFRALLQDFEDLLQVCSTHLLFSTPYLRTYLLQCAIPVFDQLVPPPHNKTILDLLFVLGMWHALAKL
jgi:hypothetical protein